MYKQFQTLAINSSAVAHCVLKGRDCQLLSRWLHPQSGATCIAARIGIVITQRLFTSTSETPTQLLGKSHAASSKASNFSWAAQVGRTIAIGVGHRHQSPEA